MRTRTRPASPVSLEYLPALDGIRGVAVVAVIATHTVATIPGGFLSVDVFFALSGYLITSLLVAEWRQSDTIALGRFWSRRARRLLPALFLMLTAVGAGAALWPQIFGSPSLRGDTLATVFYVANWHFIADHTNYFLATGRASPLLHTWSLAIEEQFYLVWPIVVLAVLNRPPTAGDAGTGHDDGTGERAPTARALRRRRHRRAGVGDVDGGADPRRRRHDAQLLRQRHPRPGHPGRRGARRRERVWGPARSRRARSALWGWGVAGVVGTALLWSFVPQNSLWVFRVASSLAALCTAGVIACVANLPATRLATMLCWRPLRYVGRISYGMYLWYWPLCSCCRPPAPTSGATRSWRCAWWRSSPWPACRRTWSSCPSAGPSPEVVDAAGHARRRRPGRAHHVPRHGGGEPVAAASVSADHDVLGTGTAGCVGSGRSCGSGPDHDDGVPRPRQGAHRGGLGGGHARGGSRQGDGAVRRGGGERGQPGLLGVDGPAGAGAVVHRPTRSAVRERRPGRPLRPVARLGGRVQSRRRHLHGPQRGAQPGGEFHLDPPRGARLRLVRHGPVPPGHRRPRLTRRARGPADVPVLRHGCQPSGSPWPEDDPSPRHHRQPDHRVHGRRRRRELGRRTGLGVVGRRTRLGDLGRYARCADGGARSRARARACSPASRATARSR